MARQRTLKLSSDESLSHVSDSQEPSSSEPEEAENTTRATSLQVSTPTVPKTQPRQKSAQSDVEPEKWSDRPVQEPMRTTQQQQGATTSGSSPNRRRPQRTSAASASKNLKLKQVDLTESEEGQDESEDEKPNEKRLQGRRSGGQRAPLSLQAAQGKKRKRAAVESTSEESSGSGDNFAPEPEEQQESSSSEDDVAQASDSNNASDTDATKRPQPRARSKKSKKSAAPALKANDDESDSDRPLAAAATAASSSKRPYGGTVKHEDNLDMSLRDPFLMAESADDSDLEDGEDLDDLLNELAAMQRGKKRTKTELSEEDRRRMRSETPKETPEEEKARKKREKEYKKSRGSNWNYADKVQLKLEKHHPELVNVWGNLEKEVGIIKPTKAPQPAYIAQKLLPFQLEGLDWMQKQEAGPWRGGMLADEMGMGKTIQTISLVCSDYDPSLPMPKRKKTLVIAPTVAIVQWRNEFSKFTSGFKVDVWHGQSRSTDIKKIQEFDVVLTSYAVLESIYRRQEKGFVRNKQNRKEQSALHAIKWHRVILDEAHNIKDRGSNTAKASFALRAVYRWCLSGTPLQNRVGELYSLIRFLGVLPFAANFCTKCSCRTLHWKFSNKKHCDDCGHTPMQHSWYWNNQILKPIQKYGHSGDGADAFKKLHTLLDRMMLRRTKVERADDLSLPPRTITVRRDYFTEEEEELYTSLYSDVQRKFGTYIEAGTVLNNYGNIFTLITRMRQMACHPDLVLKSKTAKHKIVDSADADFSINACRICLDEAEDPIMSKCRHIFCRLCIADVVEGCGTENTPECPTCHARLVINLEAPALELEPSGGQPTKSVAQQGMLDRIDPRKWKTSTKIVALMEELMKLRQEDHTAKALVFSTSTSFLDLIARQLQLGGFKLARLQGTMAPEQRDRTVKYFMNNVDVQVFLLSLKAGGVALNLTEASHVFLVDPWWNPSAEVQAMDRIHRIGQARPVKVTRLIIENSIESRILELQKKKESMIDAAFGDSEALGRLTPEDLRFLFTL